MCPLIGYDFTRMGKVIVDNLGTVDGNDRAKLEEIVERDFGLKDAESFVTILCDDYKKIGAYDDPDFRLQFLFYDPRKDMDAFVRDFAANSLLFSVNFLLQRNMLKSTIITSCLILNLIRSFLLIGF
jgi:hypothetical protein